MEAEFKNFVHLHVHTEYSLLDGSGKVEKLVQRAKELGMKSIAITDHGAMYGCVEFYKAAKEANIKPIIGCEIYVAGKSMYIKEPNPDNQTYHLVLLVKNETGYRNLMEIVSRASIDGFYYKPRVDHEYLKSHSEGLIASSACFGGEVQSYILKDNLEKAKQAALFYKDVFKEGFYLELQYHELENDMKVNDTLVSMSKELDIPLIATNDVHYINKEDSIAHDILLCIQTGKTLEDENRMRYAPEQFYLKSQEEMYEQFSYAKDALLNTSKIADECNFDYKFHESKLPNFPLPEGTDHYEYLKNLCYSGLEERYKEITDKLKDRLEYELGIIKKMGYVDYFLIVWDFIKFAREHDVPTGPGRGSAAGSIVAYTLGITKIDPIKYSLIFERFLNPDRVSMPDIDSDFCYAKRQKVIDYVVEKYGKDCVSQIVTFGTMAARLCIRDVGRAMNYSYGEVDKIAKMIPNVLNITIDKALEMNPELKAEYESDDRIKDLIDISRKLEGLPRHTSTHAAGVVISSQPLVNYVPLLKNEESIVAQFTMGILEELGLLKMDFLGLRTLTVISDTIKMVKQNRNIDVDIDNIDFDDSSVYKMVGEGKTVGVFQLESSGMTSFMKELKPDSLEDIIAGISLYRPGPMNEIPRYIKNKNNPEEIKYVTPELKHILDVTYGCIIYQEQVMQIVRDLAGYSMGRSDLVRRAMSKKKHHVMEEERYNFIHGVVSEDGKIEVPGCIRNGISEKIANDIFDSMMDFASYAFNKSHAAAYAVVAYETAYLVHYYPGEYLAAMLNSVMGNNEKVAFYIRCAEELGIQVLPPDINESYSKFTVKKDTIRFGLAAIKNVGVNVIESIVKARESKGNFVSFNDFCNKIDTSEVNKRAVESIIKAGGFDTLGVYRSKLLAVHEKIMDGISGQRKKNIKGQMNLFTDFGQEEYKQVEIQYPNIKEFDKKYLLAMEKEMTGLYLSGHPLEDYEETLKRVTSIKISEIVVSQSLEDDDSVDDASKIKDGTRVIVGGIITSVTKKVTKSNTMMAFAKIEDMYAAIEVVIFPKTLEKNVSYIKEDEMVIIKGRINKREDEQPKIICEEISPIIKSSEKIYILVEDDEVKNSISAMRKMLFLYRGETPIYLCTKRSRKKFLIDKSLWVEDKDELIKFLKDKFGEDNVKVL